MLTVIIVLIIILLPFWILSGLAWQAGLREAKLKAMMLQKLEEENAKKDKEKEEKE